MREFLVLIIAVAVGYFLYTIYFSPEARRDHGDAGAVAVPDTPLPQTSVLSLGSGTDLVAGGVSHRIGIGVISDSRCPKGAQCVRAGEGIVVVWIEPAGGTRSEIKLSTAEKELVALGPVAARITALEPYPVMGETIGRNEYRVSLELDRRSALEKTGS